MSNNYINQTRFPCFMKLFIEQTNESIELQLNKKTKILSILKKYNINPEEVVILKNNQISTEDNYIDNDDELKLLSVVSGG